MKEIAAIEAMEREAEAERKRNNPLIADLATAAGADRGGALSHQITRMAAVTEEAAPPGGPAAAAAAAAGEGKQKEPAAKKGTGLDIQIM